jgi:hypothetical protein
MKAPLPPPPARRARRSTRASQGGAPGRSDSSRQSEGTASLEDQSQGQSQHFDTPDSRGIEFDERREDGLAQAEAKPSESHQEPTPEQASAQEESPPEDQPQRQVPESGGIHEDSDDKPGSQDEQSQLQGAVPKHQPMSESDTKTPEAIVEEHAPAADKVTGENQDSLNEAQEQAPVRSETGEQQGTVASAGARSDGDVQKSLAEEVPVHESSDGKERTTHNDDAQERPRSRNEDAATDTSSQNYDQASEAQDKGVDIVSDAAGPSTEPAAVGHHQEAPPNQERHELPEQVTTREDRPAEKSANKDATDPSYFESTADERTTLDGPADHEGLIGPGQYDLVQGVAKGGAAEEYVKTAEAESGREPPLGGNTTPTPAQASSSGNYQQREQQNGDSSRGIEELESSQVNIPTTDLENLEQTTQAKSDEQPLSASQPSDSVAESEAHPPVGREGEIGHLQSRDIDTLDHQDSNHEPTLVPEKRPQGSHEQEEVDPPQDPETSSTGGGQHEQLRTSSQDSPDADSSDGEQLQESDNGEHRQGGNASMDPGYQPRELGPTHGESSEIGKPNADEPEVTEKDLDDPQSAEDQQEPDGDENNEDSLQTKISEQEHQGHDIPGPFESTPGSQQGSSSSDLSVPAASGQDSLLERDDGGNEAHGSSGGHEPPQGRQESQTPKDDHAGGNLADDVPLSTPQDTPAIVEPDNTDALPHETASEHEHEDKRSDSGYETGMAGSRNLEDSTNTLHEGQPAREAEHSFDDTHSENMQDGTKEIHQEQILEGSGKDMSPPSQGGGRQDSDGHPVEENFDLSGSEPIPGTMTHGKDGTGDQDGESSGRDIGLPDMANLQSAGDGATGATAGNNQSSTAVDESRESTAEEESRPHESGQQFDDEDLQPEPRPVTHGGDDARSADMGSQGTEEHPRQEAPQSAVGSVSKGTSGETESSSEPHAVSETQSEESTPSDGQIGQLHPEEDVKSTNSRGKDEPQPETSVGNGGDGVPPLQEQIPEPSQASQLDSPNANGIDLNQFGSWSSQTLSQPANDHEFSFKKRADSVQVGRAHGAADRGADLPSINTGGPNEDADEGLFAVPPTPRHEVEHEKPSGLQGNGESKPPSRASSRDGSVRADKLPPTAAEVLQDPYREETEPAVLPETASSKDDTHNIDPNGLRDSPTANADALDTNESSEERKAMSYHGSEQPSNCGELDHGRTEEPSTVGAEITPQEASAGTDSSQQDHQNDVHSPLGPEEQRNPGEGLLDDSPLPEKPPAEQHSDILSKPDVANDNGGIQTGLDDQASDGPAEHLEHQDMNPEPDPEHFQPGSGETGKLVLDDDDQGGHGEVPEPQTIEDQPRSISLEAKEPASDGDASKNIADPAQVDQSGTQLPGPISASEGKQLERECANISGAAHQQSLDHSSQHLDAQRVNYDGEGYGVTPSSEYSNDPLADSTPREQIEKHPVAGDSATTTTHQADTLANDLPDSAVATRSDDPMDGDSDNFETPLESAGFRTPQKDSRPVTSGSFTQALDHLPDESAHTVQGTDDLFDDTDDAEEQDDFGEAVVYQNPSEAAGSSPTVERTVYSTRGDENNTALGGHRSSLSLGSVGHRSQGSISSMRETTPVRTTFGSYIGGPNIVRADWAAEHEDELRQPSLNPTPQLGPSTTHDTPEISPFALRNTPMAGQGGEQRGLHSSMWNPDRPQTPTSATPHSNNPFATPQGPAESDFDPSLFVPRDVTRGRQDSVPASLHSQTTLDSSWSSPVHSSLPVDRHEPVIRDSWPAPAPGYQQYLASWSSRPRGDTTSTTAEYDPFKPDNGGAPGGHAAARPSSNYNPFLQRGRAESSVSATPSNPSVSNSPSRGSALFAKMRNIFEGPGSHGASDVPASPGKTRPVSGAFIPVTSSQSKTQAQDSTTGHGGDDERGGFLNEADHEIDERSAFLRSDGQPSGH